MRLMFESRLKEVNGKYHELENENEKATHVYAITLEQVKRFEALSKNQSAQLLALREEKTEGSARTEILEEFKTFANNDLKHKKQVIDAAEIARVKA